MTMRLFEETGVHVLVDGQFGSTGKGALAAFLCAEAVRTGAIQRFDGAISSSGPNSGHTSYSGHAKIVLKQLPTFAVHAHLNGHTIPIYLSAGAVIDKNVLRVEANWHPRIPIFVHPNAAVLAPEDKVAEAYGSIADVASTQSGTGAALARKIYRHPNAIAINALKDMPPNVSIMIHRPKPEIGAYFMEIAQGFSLGINSEFYPHVTSRECTVMQGLADARIPISQLAKVYACFRTFPIRVGDLDGHSSGGWYEDQEEITWEAIGVKPELTTVTKRERRVATWSWRQFHEAMMANDPDWIAISFLDYLNNSEDRAGFIAELGEAIAEKEYNRATPIGQIHGSGPGISDWKLIPDWRMRT